MMMHCWRGFLSFILACSRNLFVCSIKELTLSFYSSLYDMFACYVRFESAEVHWQVAEERSTRSRKRSFAKT